MGIKYVEELSQAIAKGAQMTFPSPEEGKEHNEEYQKAYIYGARTWIKAILSDPERFGVTLGADKSLDEI